MILEQLENASARLKGGAKAQRLKPGFARALRTLLPVWLGFMAAGGGALRAQSDPAGDPTGSSGDIGGLVTTGGSYDPYTGNVKRVVTDIVVPGANGTIPLAFTRIYNSRGVPTSSAVGASFGDGNWRHSYQWEGHTSTKPDGRIVYNVGYPDGRVVNFVLGRSNAPAGETYARGPAGVSDRLQKVDDTHLRLHLADGSMVCLSFSSTRFQADALVDPYGSVTSLAYGVYYTDRTATVPPGPVWVLTSVTEPGGRKLVFSYGTQSYTANNGANVAVWPVFQSVTCPGSSLIGATYNYTVYSPGRDPQGANTLYAALTTVAYSPTVAGGPAVLAHYTYSADTLSAAGNSGDQTQAGAPPLLATCDDPYYAGPMARIRYAYAPGVWGVVQAEQNFATGEAVSSLGQNAFNTPTNVTETRGDAGAARAFNYGEPNTAAGATNALPFQATTVTDFQSGRSLTCYNPVGSPNGAGYVAKTVGRTGIVTSYTTEPFTGKVTQSVLTGNGNNPPLVRSSVWGGLDGGATNPYFLFQTTDERGQSVVYHRYPNTGYLYQTDYPDGSHTFLHYTGFSFNNAAFYKVDVATDQRGAQTIRAYDETDVNHGGSGQGHVGLLTSVTRVYLNGRGGTPLERTQLFYDGLDRLIQSTDPRGVSTQYAYNARGQVTRVTHPSDGTHADLAYDDYGNCVQTTDETGRSTRVAYDEYRRVLSTGTAVNDGVNPPRLSAFAYDLRDNNDNPAATALSHTGANWGVAWVGSSKAVQRVYSPNNQVTDEYDGMAVQSQGATVLPQPSSGFTHLRYTYFPDGQLQKSYDAQGFATARAYDAYDRPATVTDPLGHVSAWTYYAAGEAAIHNGAINCAGRLKSVTAPGPDLLNSPTATTQFSNYDAMGRVLETIDARGRVFASAYNAAGDLIAQSDGAQAQGAHTTTCNRDQLGRPVLVPYPDGTSETYAYDASGNPVTFKNRAGAVCTTQYDLRNRPSRKDWSDGTTAATGWGYDAAGRLTEVDSWYGNVSLAYDGAGALTGETASGLGLPAYATLYNHDIDGNVASIQYPGGNVPGFTYDCQQRPTSMNLRGATYCQYAYYGNWLTGRSLGNGLSTGYGYRNDGRVNDVRHIRAGASGYVNVRRSLYGFAPDGRVSWEDRENDGGQSGSALENGRGDAFYYWPDGSLNLAARDVAVSAGWPQVGSPTQDSRVDGNSLVYGGGTAATALNRYDYDAAGNRAAATQMNQATINYAADGENRYYGSGYDGNANTSDSRVGWTYRYDAEGRLSHADNGAGQSMDCYYDGLGRLTWRNINGAARRFCYAGSHRLEERASGTGNVLLQYFYDEAGGGGLLFRFDYTFGVLWYQRDAFGHTTHLSDNAGNIIEQYTYDAYGTPAVYDGAGHPRAGGSLYDNRSLWNSASGYEWLPGPALYHAGARFYLPQHGRWLQPDPIGQAGGLNLYTYCGNDPVNGVDPSGLAEEEGSAPKQSYGYGSDGTLSQTSSDGQADIPNMSDNSQSVGGYDSKDRLVLFPPQTPTTTTPSNGPLTLNTSDPAISWGASWGVARDPLADPHGTRNFFGGIASGAISNLVSQARGTLDLIGGNPLVNALNDAVFTGAESLLNSAGSSLAGTLGINSQSDAYQAGAPGGEFLAGAGLLLTGLGEAEVAEGGGLLYRFGSEEATLESLSSKAAEAAEAGYPHGVSSSSKLPPKYASSYRSALRSDVRQHFQIVKTGKNPFHFTVVIPNPVTQNTVNTFNSIFR